MSNYVVLKGLADFEAFIKKFPNAVIDFYADWCGPCKRIAPIYHKLAEEHPNIGFGKVNVDEVEDLSAKFEIQAMPTFVFFKGGKKIDSMAGANDGKLKEKIGSLKA